MAVPAIVTSGLEVAYNKSLELARLQRLAANLLSAGSLKDRRVAMDFIWFLNSRFVTPGMTTTINTFGGQVKAAANNAATTVVNELTALGVNP